MFEATPKTSYRLKDGTVVEVVKASEVNGRPSWSFSGDPARYVNEIDCESLYVHKTHPEWLSYFVAVLPPPKSAITVDEMAAKQAPVITVPPPLPTEDKARKALPIFRGPLMYFPHALLQVASVCKAGNDQHSPGQPMHWARGKSMEQMDTALRHMMDHGLGNTKDTDGQYHLAKAAWRILAELQLTIERDMAEAAK